MTVILKRIIFTAAICLFSSVKVFAGEVEIYIDGNKIQTDTAPIVEDGRTLVPVRGVFEYMSAEVAWQSGIVKIYSEASEIILTIGSSDFFFNGEKKTLDVPAKIINDRTYIPLRAVSELMECSVYWNEEERKVEITRERTEPQDGYLFEYEVFLLVNEIRKESGMTGFVWDEDLAEAGRMHAEDMSRRGFFDHVNPDGKSPFDRMREKGVYYLHAAENIARGFESPKETVDNWMNSEAHKANILNPDLTRLGVGYYNGYWCQEFAD